MADNEISRGDLVADRYRSSSKRPLDRAYDFIVCGSGSAGCVVARRLAKDGGANVLLLKAGGDDNAAEISDPSRWLANIGSDRDWSFRTRPNPRLNGRSLHWSMGKVLGGGSSINAMVWSRGHRRTRYSLTAEELAEVRPGLIHVDMSLHGWTGPWGGRIGFDQNAGGVTGVLTREGTPEHPKLTEIFVVNDYVMSWLSCMASAQSSSGGRAKAAGTGSASR